MIDMAKCCFICAKKFKRGDERVHYYTPDKYAMDDIVCVDCAKTLPKFSKNGEYGV